VNNRYSSTALEPEDHDLADRLHQRLIRDLDETVLRRLEGEELRDAVERAARTTAGELFPTLVGDSKEEVVHRVVDEVVGLGPIEPLLRDPTVTEVMVNAPDEVYFERDGVLYPSEVVFRDEAHIFKVIDRIVSSIGRHVDEASPMVDARLKDGSRVNVVIPPLVPRSPTITIRKFRQDRLSMDDLVAAGSMSPDIALLLEACVRSKLNMVISGGTGTGKTTLLNALSAAIPEGERIVVIEDPMELRLQQRHVISMEARPPSTEGRAEVTQRDLVRNALRMRPDRILVGEVRGAETFDMMQAMNTGHEGSLTTIHANSSRDALSRIESMVLMVGMDLPVLTIREHMASALHVIVQLARFSDGSRRVTNVTEISGMEGPVITLQDLFVFKQTGIDPLGKVVGELRATGIRPKLADRIRTFGIKLPDNMFAIERWG